MQISRVGLLPSDFVPKITPIQDPAVEAFTLQFNLAPDSDPSVACMRHFISKFLESPEGMLFVNNPESGPRIFVVDPIKPLQGLQALGFEAAKRIEESAKIEDGDLLVLQARHNRPFGGGSTPLAPTGFAPLWVTGFPLSSPTSQTEPGQGGNAGLAATHHPLTSPKTSEDIDMLVVDPAKVIGDHYDLVINGVALGGASRRIHNAEMQAFVMQDILAMSHARLAEFSHLLEVLRA